MTPAELDDCVEWLEAKYNRHGEIEDKNCAYAIAALRDENRTFQEIIGSDLRSYQQVIAERDRLRADLAAKDAEISARSDLQQAYLDCWRNERERAEADAAALRALLREPMKNITPLYWMRRQDVLQYRPIIAAYIDKPADENGYPPVPVYSQDQIDAAMIAARAALGADHAD